MTVEDKVTHFIANMYDSEPFETKTTEDWEDSTDQFWVMILALFNAEYGKIQWALKCASQKKITTAPLLYVIQQPAPVT